MAEGFGEFLREQVLQHFCPGYSPDDPTVVKETPVPPIKSASGGELVPRLVRIQAGTLPDGPDGRLELIVTDGRHDCLMIPSEPALKAFFHENADISKASFLADRRTGTGTENAPMVGEVVRLEDYRLLLESGPIPVYGVRRMTYMEGMADELGGDEEEEEEEEEDEEGKKKEKAPKPEDPLLTELEKERILTVRRRGVRGDTADQRVAHAWQQMQTGQTNPPPTAKATDPDAGVLTTKAVCLHSRYAHALVGTKVLYFFDKPGRCNSVQERVVTVLDTERAHYMRHLLKDTRVPADAETDLG